MRPALAALALLLIACNRPDRRTMPVAEAAHERNLQTSVTAPTVDTSTQRRPNELSQRQADEWQRCLYVYHDQPDRKIRECLVIQFKWAPADAERRIDVFLDSLRLARDSLARVADSLRRAERRRRDSIYLATHRERLDGPEVGYESSGPVIWVADRRTGAYYRTDCDAAKRIPVDARVLYPFEDDAIAAKRWPSRQPGCR
jgi:hypothetical protein